MKTAFYYSPGLPAKLYQCRNGAAPGTVDLLNADGRVIVSGLPVVTVVEEGENRPCALVVPETPPKKAPSQAGKKKNLVMDRETVKTSTTEDDVV